MTEAAAIRTRRAGRARFRPRIRGRQTAFCLAMLATYLVVVYFLIPGELPQFFQRLVGLVNALLGMVTAMFAVREYAGSYNRVRLPWRRSIRLSTIVGVLVFAAVLAWWFTPWAPIQPL